MANNTMTIEELKGMKRDELRAAAQAVGIKGYSRMKKDDLVQALVPFCKPELKVDIVEVKKEETAMVEKKWSEMTIEEKKNFALLDRWNTLVKATAKEFTLQSLNEEYANKAAGKNMGNIWRLFYKNTKSVVTKDEYCVKQNRLFAAAGRAITLTYGEENNNDEHVRQLLNVMFFRGYLNCVSVAGKDGKKNTVVSITQAQMDSMVALSK